MPARKKPVHLKQDRHPTRMRVVGLEGGRFPPPNPDPAWLEGTKDRWGEYWASEVAHAAEKVDIPAATRLFGYYDEHERALRAVRKARMVEGSTGQPRLNPLADYLIKLEGTIHRLETDLGLTPKARIALGLAIGQAKLTAAQINRMTDDHEDAVEAEILEEFEAAE